MANLKKADVVSFILKSVGCGNCGKAGLSTNSKHSEHTQGKVEFSCPSCLHSFSLYIVGD